MSVEQTSKPAADADTNYCDATEVVDPQRNASTRSPRSSVMLMAKLQHQPGAQPTQHRVRNMSASGMLIDNAVKLQPEQFVTISFGTVEAVPATVKWVDRGLAGLSFDESSSHGAEVKQDKSSRTRVEATIEAKAGWISELRNPYRKS